MDYLSNTWRYVEYIDSAGIYAILNDTTAKSRRWEIHPDWAYSEDEINRIKQRNNYLKNIYENSSIDTDSTLEWSV